MAYIFEMNGSPYFYQGFVNEAGTADRKVAERPDGSKIRVDGRTQEQVRQAPDGAGKPREMKQARKDAEAAADKTERDCKARREGRMDPELTTGFTFAMLATKYLEEHASGMASEDTIKSRMKHLVRYFGPRMLVSILPTDIKAYTKKMLREPTELIEGISRSGEVLSARSVEHLRVQLRQMFNFAKEAKLVRSNPVLPTSQVDVPRVDIRLLDNDQVVLLLQHADQAWRAFIAVAVYCGLRKGEVIGLLTKNVDLKRGLITVANSYRGPPKNGKTRIVPIPPDLVPYLQVELGRIRSTHLFPNSKGQMWSKHTKTEEIIRRAAVAAGLVQGFDHLCRRKGCGFTERRADKAASRCPKCEMLLWVRPICIDLKFKDTRSTCATAVYEATGDERFVTDMLGHCDPRVTDLYRKTRLAHLTLQGAKISYSSPNSLRMDQATDNAGAQVIRFPQSSSEVTECARRESNPRPLDSKTTGAVLEGVVADGIPSQSLALGSSRQSHPVGPISTVSPGVSPNPLRVPREAAPILPLATGPARRSPVPARLDPEQVLVGQLAGIRMLRGAR